jgi:mono/diheme cytochrome c family protein
MKNDYHAQAIFLSFMMVALMMTTIVRATSGQDDDPIGDLGTEAIALLNATGSQAANEELERGRKAYIETGCYQCHGYQGHGGSAGPRLAPAPMRLVAFSRLVRKPANVMPAYSQTVLSDEQMAIIHKYLESIPPPPEASSLPQLSWE